jgi:hypothetical protein
MNSKLEFEKYQVWMFKMQIKDLLFVTWVIGIIVVCVVLIIKG